LQREHELKVISTEAVQLAHSLEFVRGEAFLEMDMNKEEVTMEYGVVSEIQIDYRGDHRM
jgi:hypothetical protein